MTTLTRLTSRIPVMLAAIALVVAMGGEWTTSASAAPTVLAKSTSPPSSPSPGDDPDPARGRPVKKAPSGRINLNTATEEQLMMLPTVGPAKAERIVSWRKKNGGFKRVADLRRVKGFGYKTFKRLEPLLDIKGDTTLAQK